MDAAHHGAPGAPTPGGIRPPPDCPGVGGSIYPQLMTDEQTGIRLNLERRPTEDVPVHDEEACRRWLIGHVETQMMHAGGVLPRLLYFGEGWIETLDLSKVDLLGNEEAVARAFVALGFQRPGVLRRFRVGHVLLRDETGSMRRAAAILEHAPEPDETHQGNEGDLTGSWWCAHRFVGQANDGLGALHGDDWSIAQGTDVTDMPEPLQEWLDVSRAELKTIVQDVKPRNDPFPEVRMAVAEIHGELPDKPRNVAGLVGSMIRDELRQSGLRCLLLFAVTPTTFERWEFLGQIPCTVDDILRAISQRDETIIAIGHVGLATLHLNQEARRAFFCTMEMDGRRGRWLLPVLQPGDPLPVDHPGLEQDLGPVPDGDLPWIGAEPTAEIDFKLLGMEGLVGGIPEA